MAASWDDHPYKYTGHLWLYQPALVWSATFDRATTLTDGFYSTTDILERLFWDVEQVGAVAMLKEGMTVALGSTIGGWDYGWARLRGTTTYEAETVLLVWTPEHGSPTEGGRVGEFYLATPAYVSVFDDYRVWAKLPFLEGATGYWDGQNGAGGTVYRQLPVANAGTMRADWDVSDVKSFVFTGEDSFAASPKGYLGQLTAGTPFNITASSQVGANFAVNAFDGNPGTYWEGSTQGESISWDMNDKPIAVDITAETANGAPKDFQILASHEDWGVFVIVQQITGEVGWSIGETRRYYVETQFGSDRWTSPPEISLSVTATQGGTAVKIRALDVYYEDRATTSPYTWDVADGTITVGSTTTEDITTQFPVGFRYVELSVEDAESSQSGATHTPVLVATKNPTDAAISYSGATASASDEDIGHLAAAAFDGIPATYWNVSVPGASEWLKTQLAAAARVTGYRITAYSTVAPSEWQVEGSADDISWDLLDSRTGEAFTSGGNPTTNTYTFRGAMHTYLYYRITITDNNGATAFRVNEWTLWLDETPYKPIENFTITEHRLGQRGQRMSFEVFEDITWTDYRPGTLMVYFEDEWLPAQYYEATQLTQLANLQGYWPIWEASGATISDESGNSRDGTQTDVVLGVTGIGDGQTAGQWNAGSPRIDVFGAGLSGAFDEATGSIIAWIKPDAAAWAAASDYYVLRFQVDNDNYVHIVINDTNNLRFTYRAGGASTNLNITGSRTDWFPVVFTWDTSEDETKAYVAGELVGTGTSLGTWVGALASAFVGAFSAGSGHWDGELAHVSVWDTVLTASQIKRLANIVTPFQVEGSLPAAGPDGRENVKSWGWLDESREGIRPNEKSTQITLLDVAQRLAQLPGFPFVIENDYTDALPAYYNLMDGACIDRLVYLVGRWLSSVAEVTDFLPIRDFCLWQFPILEVAGSDLWEMLRGRAEASLVRLGSTKHGAIKFNLDYQMQTSAPLPTATISIDEGDIVDINYSNTPTPRLHWGWAAAVRKDWDDPTGGGFTVVSSRVVAPGQAPGQGLRSAEQNELLMQDLDDLKARAGQLYAYENAPHLRFAIELAHGADTGLDPGDMQYVALTVSDDYAARRGYTWASEKMWLFEMEIRHPRGEFKQVILHLEDYIVGTDSDEVT